MFYVLCFVADVLCGMFGWLAAETEKQRGKKKKKKKKEIEIRSHCMLIDNTEALAWAPCPSSKYSTHLLYQSILLLRTA